MEIYKADRIEQRMIIVQMLRRETYLNRKDCADTLSEIIQFISMKTSNCEKEIREKKRKEVDCMWISK
jgi:hypothetical protein